MRADILLTALAGVSSASAAVMRIAADSIEYDWAVTGWSAGCARAGCYYGSSESSPYGVILLIIVVDFNVTGAENLTSRPATPAFKAYCSGDGEGSPYRLCQRLDEEDTDAIVVAKLLPSTTTNGTRHAKIQVILKYNGYLFVVSAAS